MRTNRQDARRRQEQEDREEEYRKVVEQYTELPKSVSLVPLPVTDMDQRDSLLKSIPLIILAYALGITAIGINGWFSYCRGVTLIDKGIFCGLGFFADASTFYLPAHVSKQWKGKRYGAFLTCCVVYGLCVVFAVSNSLGFASQNLTDTATARAERITPAVSDAQRKVNTLSASRKGECEAKRGTRCWQLEKQEQQALAELKEARERVSANADPQTVAASKLVSWVSLGRYNPTAQDFAMLELLLLTFLPQVSGLVLAIAKKP